MNSEMPKKKIFIVEDDMYVQEMLQHLFAIGGYDIHIIDDGLKALDALEKEIPDLILIDIMLPKVNGIELCKKLRGSERTNKVPIILMSAVTKVDKSEIEPLNIDYVIYKPFDVTEILNQVEKLLHRGA